jgi:hypothetical protein
MKRKNYIITSSVGHRVVKHAWNSSIREIEKLVQEMAQQEHTTYTLTGTNSVKEGFNHVSGYREWQSKATGKYVMFDVELEK